MSKVTLNDITSGYAAPSLYNENNNRLEEALENTLSRDGTLPNSMEAELDMDGRKVVNLGPPEALSDAARLQDVMDNVTSITNITAPSQTGNNGKPLTTDGSSVAWGNARFNRTSAEQAAGITPTNFGFDPGDINRYGTNTTPGTTDMSAALTAANSQSLQANGSPIFASVLVHIP